VARGNASVVARDNASVEAWGNASVVAWGNASVVARDNASVEAWGNASVVAWANVVIRLFSAIKIKASAYVTIIKHDGAAEITGGRQLEAAPEPVTGRDWCDFYGIEPDAPFKVDNLDAKILRQITINRQSFDMRSFHGADCTPDDWCNTTHCRAGFAICLAGKPGFDLEKKYGAELAGRMIYAVSRPDMPLPDFYADDDDAIHDLEECAIGADKVSR
jgi:hypothetical protein